jgi:hypothetical protein
MPGKSFHNFSVCFTEMALVFRNWTCSQGDFTFNYCNPHLISYRILTRLLISRLWPTQVFICVKDANIFFFLNETWPWSLNFSVLSQQPFQLLPFFMCRIWTHLIYVFLIFEDEVCYVAHAALQLVASSGPPSSVFRVAVNLLICLADITWFCKDAPFWSYKLIKPSLTSKWLF